jgi:L-erythro-3,5-diaminohexanoate dehydrogenase
MPAPHPFGLHRSLDPPGVLPQLARRLDATPRALENEMAVAVRALSIDSASFRQLRETEAATGESIRDQVARIVRERGKMQNPVTGSGGMLLGEVAEIGRAHPAFGTMTPGTPIATLVSLTLTPLHLESIGAVHAATERLEASGTAILFARTLFARLPDDFPEEIALAAFDVAGAPAAVLRDAAPGQTVLIIGTGKAGLLCLAAARERVGASGRVLAVEPGAAAAERARSLGYADAVFAIDARDPVAMLGAIESATGGRLCDLVVNVANAGGTESASVLCARDDGAVLFFGMATSFSAAALGAEGLAKPTRLAIGNGFVPGHDRTALGLLRRHPALARAFASLSAGLAAGPAA